MHVVKDQNRYGPGKKPASAWVSDIWRSSHRASFLCQVALHSPAFFPTKMPGGCDSGPLESWVCPKPSPMIMRSESQTPGQGVRTCLLIRYGKTTIMAEEHERIVRWIGDSLEVLRAFPEKVRWSFGRALNQVQKGIRPSISSPMRGRLSGVIELSERDPGGAYRLYFTLNCPGEVHVLLCHKKKSKRGIGIPKREADLIVQRFKNTLMDCRGG